MRRLSTIHRRSAVLFGLACVIVLFAFHASAQNLVYHSPNDDGVNPGTTYNLPVGPGDSLFLYLDTGSFASQGGTPCNDGDGREICGYEVVVDALGSAFFVDFIPESNVVHRLTPTQAKINGLFSLNPALGAVRIGELKAGSSDQDGAVMMTGGKVVLAALQVETVPQQMLASVPEPSGALPLLAGAALLIGLGAARRSRDRVRIRSFEPL